MFTDRPARAEAEAGQLVLVGGERYLDVPLYWQHWRLRTTVLDDLATSVRRVAARVLAPRE
jgi:LysR family transcriptional regulator (chromosome initiation inhibitor)